MGTDPFGRAVRDHHLGESAGPLVVRDGEETLEHPIEAFYFDSIADEETTAWIEKRIDGPLLDIGAGAGKHALYFQERFETVAVEVSEDLVAVMDDRGVEDAREGDMFALREDFERDRFDSVLAYGTQACLTGSLAGLREFLADLAWITAPGATAVIDGYDPASPATADLLGYRADPTPGLAHRVMTFEYDGTVGETLLFRLFSPDRLREATVGTAWTVDEVRTDEEGSHYLAALEKE
jgi:hypothetical protein